MGIGLYDYQIDAVKHMKNGCILNGGVGTGKSRTSLAYYYVRNGGGYEFLEKGTENKPGWIRTMNNPPKDLYIITTARKRDTKEWLGDMAPFCLSTNEEANRYDNKVVIDSWNNIGKYTNIENAFFIFDEDRVVGSGAWVKAFLKITKNNEWILLTATPGDTWQDYRAVFIANGFYKNKTEFDREHIVYDYRAKFPKISRYINTGRLIKYRNSILVDMNYNRKTVRHHEDVYVSFDVSKYKDIIRNRWDIWEDKPIENASGLCYAMRKVVNIDETRQKAILEILEDHDRAIIFYNFNYELDILKSMIYGEGVEIAEWNGHKHEPIPNSDKWVYLCQYTSAAEGWNCITTNCIIFYSQNYSYKTMEQASGRIDRLNTPFKDLYYYHIKSRAGIDLAISRSLHDKKTFNESRYVGTTIQAGLSKNLFY